AASRAPLPARGRGRTGGAATWARRTRSIGDRARAARERDARPLCRVLGQPDRGARGPVTETVLHVGKVSGVSGSEAHLLTLLPDLRERGWDVGFAHLHENEPGAEEFARRMAAVGVPVE